VKFRRAAPLALAVPEHVALALPEHVFVAAAALRPIEPVAGLRVTARGRPGDVLTGHTEPESARGIWPDPVWRVGSLAGARRIPTYDSERSGVASSLVGFEAATLIAVEPSWRRFGPRGQAIESIFRATLALSPAQIRAARTLGVQPLPTRSRDPHAPLAWQLGRTLNDRLVEKAEREDPESGGWEMYGGGCVLIWEWDDPGWRSAEWATISAALSVLEGEEDAASGAVLEQWRSLVNRQPLPA
jgi:hypothetical protein